ncbi:MAG: hypothetical protein COW63_08520 [Bacteroidetes bacterium CG18_big_fil_WC_8_21_14_2_50_41_14]|nr:MAG: hypothetical protein COW63_08520 [Bacteroidetes bacterium CG18_big_fil_WC_8_21_14_2_50_41_14]
MKKSFVQLLIIVSFTFTSTFLLAQDAPPPPPPPPSDHGGTGNAPADGGAPIGGGLFILLGLGAAYGGKKLYDLRKESIEE